MKKKIYLVNVTKDDWFNKMTEKQRYESVENLFEYVKEKKSMNYYPARLAAKRAKPKK